MGVNIVKYGNQTLIDLTDTTAVASDVTQGKYFYGKDGVKTEGTATGGGGILVLIGTYEAELEEYTSTDTETINTGIDVMNTNYAYGIVTINCDSAITTSTEWGLSLITWGRYKSNSKILTISNAWQKGSASLDLSAMATNTQNTNGYGVGINNNADTVRFWRKAHATGCPKVRGGKYTVNVYGFVGL